MHDKCDFCNELRDLKLILVTHQLFYARSKKEPRVDGVVLPTPTYLCDECMPLFEPGYTA